MVVPSIITYQKYEAVRNDDAILLYITIPTKLIHASVRLYSYFSTLSFFLVVFVSRRSYVMYK